jgi:hypothetical protein
MASGGANPRFSQVQLTDCAASCPAVSVVDDPYWSEAGGNVIAVAAGSDGSIYTASLGGGSAVAR